MENLREYHKGNCGTDSHVLARNFYKKAHAENGQFIKNIGEQDILFEDIDGNVLGKSKAGQVTFYVFGEIVADEIWYPGFPVNSAIRWLSGLDNVSSVELVVNSPGGFVTSSIAFCAFLRKNKYDISVDVIGMCGSAATYFLAVTNKTRASDSAEFLVHNSSMLVRQPADKKYLREMADFLEKTDDEIANIYAKIAKDVNFWKELMDKESFLSTDEMIEYGMVQEKYSTFGNFQENSAENLIKNKIGADAACIGVSQGNSSADGEQKLGNVANIIRLYDFLLEEVTCRMK